MYYVYKGVTYRISCFIKAVSYSLPVLGGYYVPYANCCYDEFKCT